MTVFIIKDDAGAVINRVVGELSVIETMYTNFEEELQENTLSVEIEARQWRDNELERTDRFVPITDHPQHAAYLAYRQALRDWPSTADFPDTRPELGV